MADINYSEKIPNNVNLARGPHAAARARAVAAQLPLLVEGHGARGVARLRRLPAHGGQRRPRRLGALRLREDAGLPLGHLPHARRTQRARSSSARTRASPCGRRCPASTARNLRRIIVTQGDTEPASVEQQRHLGLTAPSLYDLRNLFQVNVEEGRHLWAMVYLLHTHFGRDGREEAEALLERRSGDADNPRILGAFNERDARLARVLHVHLLHRPRRQVPALRARRVGLRPARAHDAASC